MNVSVCVYEIGTRKSGWLHNIKARTIVSTIVIASFFFQKNRMAYFSDISLMLYHILDLFSLFLLNKNWKFWFKITTFRNNQHRLKSTNEKLLITSAIFLCLSIFFSEKTHFQYLNHCHVYIQARQSLKIN